MWFLNILSEVHPHPTPPPATHRTWYWHPGDQRHLSKGVGKKRWEDRTPMKTSHLTVKGFVTMLLTQKILNKQGSGGDVFIFWQIIYENSTATLSVSDKNRMQPQRAENGDSDLLSWTLLEMLARAISQEKAVNSIQTGKKKEVKHRQKDLL